MDEQLKQLESSAHNLRASEHCHIGTGQTRTHPTACGVEVREAAGLRREPRGESIETGASVSLSGR